VEGVLSKDMATASEYHQNYLQKS